MSQSTHVHRLGVEQHGLTRERVNANALDVTSKLHEAGFAGLLVGGCVRDLLLGHTPKDFDIATDATPEEVNALFRRSRVIGRRFRIVHVRYGRELIEVSTFRRAHAESADERSHSDSGMILRDNVFGNQSEDAFRRDFTINALYYDPQTEEVLDYVGGLTDLEHKRICFIGETLTRVREDPVRVLRAIRFHAKLGFNIDSRIADCYPAAADLMAAIPPARLFDEILKLLLSGQAESTWQALAETPLRAALFPASDPDSMLTTLAMRNTDQRIADKKPITPGFLIAILLWDDYLVRTSELEQQVKPAEAQSRAAFEALSEQHKIISIPRRFSQFAREVWQMQGRLEARPARSITRILAHPRFRAGYDFLVLRAAANEKSAGAEEGTVPTGEPLEELAQWWTDIQSVSEADRASMIDALRATQPKGSKRRKRRKRLRMESTESTENASSTDATSSAAGGTANNSDSSPVDPGIE